MASAKKPKTESSKTKENKETKKTTTRTTKKAVPKTNLKVDEDTDNIIGEFTPKKDEKIIRILPIAPTEIKTKSIINKEDIETKYGIVTYNPNKPNKKGND